MITELTEEQKKMMPVYDDKWVKIGLSCESFKEQTINLLYEKILNKKRPAEIILSPSPLQAWQQLCEQIAKQGREQVCEQLREQAQALEQEKKQMLQRRWMQAENQQVCEQAQVLELAKKSALQQIGVMQSEYQYRWVQIRNHIQEQAWQQVEQIGCHIYSCRLQDHTHYYFDAHYDFSAYYFAFYDYFNCAVDTTQCPENWSIYSIFRTTEEFGFIYMLDDICIISDRPEQITMKGRVLHNESGMAIKYRDGWGIYALNGVMVTKEIVETPPDKLNPEIVLKETSAEARREIVRKIGVERLEKKLKPLVLDKWGDYELHDYSEFFPEMRCRPVYLKMKNPSIGVWHYEGVNINEMEAPTCQAALKWRLKGKDFKPIRIT